MPVIGIAIIALVIYLAQMPVVSTARNFFDITSLIFVSGGVIGSMMISLDARTFLNTFLSLRLLFMRKSLHRKRVKAALFEIFQLWNQGKKAAVLSYNSVKDPIVDITIDTLISKLPSEAVTNRFEWIISKEEGKTLPLIDAWELCSRTAPVFGMIGTVIGLYRMFQGFSSGSDVNLGSAMALALLTTLYGILIGYGFATPVYTRIQSIYNQDLYLLRLAHMGILAISRGHIPDFMLAEHISRPTHLDTEETSGESK